MDVALLVKALTAFFAIMNPFVNLPLFLSLTANQEAATQRRTAMRVVMFCAIMCIVVLGTGSAFLKMFGVSVDDFRVAGGLVLLIISLGMLSGKGSTAHEGTKGEKRQQSDRAAANDVAFYPLTFPMLVGPGTIATIIVMDAHTQGLGDRLTVALALAAVLVLLGVVLFFSAQIGHHMSLTLRTIMTRLMGMILLSIAVSMMAAGLTTLFPGWV